MCKGHRPVDPGGGQPAKSLGRPASFWVGLDQNLLDTCLHEKGKAMAVQKVGESHHLCHTPFRESGNEASICVPRMFHSHV
jgi:hypothetical protein